MGTTATQQSRRTQNNSAQANSVQNHSGEKLSVNGRPTPAVDLKDSSLFINRELSLLAFQRRVLEEAQDESNPLLERIKFLSILGSNLDEFFMVRVAGLKRQVEAGSVEVGPDGMSPADQLEAIRAEVNALMTNAARCYRKQLAPALEKAGIFVRSFASLTDAQKARATKFFENSVFPVLTPLAFDPGRPFPHISNLSVNMAVIIRDGNGEQQFARVKVPEGLPQLIRVDAPQAATKRKSQTQTFVWIEDLIASNLGALFPGMRVVETHPFHVTRDADIEIQELEAGDLLETTEEGLRQRRFGDVVRLQVDQDMPPAMLRILMNNLEVTRADVYRMRGPLRISRMGALSSLDRPELKYQPFVPSVPKALDFDPEEENIFTAIRRRDVLLHHPFNSFQPVIDFLKSGAEDPDVLTIKMTLYRVGRNSPVVKTLLDAMENEKQVAALVELKARFDEGSNIEWAKAMERQGVHVVYGLIGLKVHSKIALVVRKEGDEIRRYIHLGTGNYNSVTAHLYTDIGLFTSDEQIGADATDLFNYLTGYSAKNDFRKLLVAPINLRKGFLALIEREIEHHKKHGGGHMILKMNALVDPEMIRCLYRASMAGVKVDLLVRGVCCLRPGIPGVSENIRVISIVGRFLEHSRIYWFHNNGDEQIYAGSADLMPRNLNRRVEVLFPIEEARLIRFLREEILDVYMADNVKAREMKPDGAYVRREVAKGEPRISSQDVLLERNRVVSEH